MHSTSQAYIYKNENLSWSFWEVKCTTLKGIFASQISRHSYHHWRHFSKGIKNIPVTALCHVKVLRQKWWQVIMQMKPAPVILNINDSHCSMIRCCAQNHVCYALSQQVQKKTKQNPIFSIIFKNKDCLQYDMTQSTSVINMEKSGGMLKTCRFFTC